MSNDKASVGFLLKWRLNNSLQCTVGKWLSPKLVFIVTKAKFVFLSVSRTLSTLNLIKSRSLELWRNVTQWHWQRQLLMSMSQLKSTALLLTDFWLTILSCVLIQYILFSSKWLLMLTTLEVFLILYLAVKIFLEMDKIFLTKERCHSDLFLPTVQCMQWIWYFLYRLAVANVENLI